MKRQRPGRSSIFAIVVAAAGAAAHAAEYPPYATTPVYPQAPPASAEAGGTWAFVGRGQHVVNGDLDDGAGEAGVTRIGLDISRVAPVGDRTIISTGLDFEASLHDWDDPLDVVPGSGSLDPWDDVYTVSYSLAATRLLDERRSIFFGGFLTTAGESGASFSDTVTGGAFVGFGQRFSPALSFRLGLGVASRLESGARIFPVVGVEWQISDAVELRSEGLGFRLTNQLNDRWSAYLRASHEDREFRLDDRNDANPNGVVRNRTVPVGIGFEWRSSRRLSVNLEGGIIALQKYDIQDSSGQTLREIETDSSGYIGLKIDRRF